MKRRLAAAAVIGLSATMTVAACGSSSSSGSGSAGGKTTIKIVAADFSKQNPNITVNVQTIDWNDLSAKVQTMVQNKQYPDILEGLTFAQYVQDGIAYKASDVLD